jgi:hypothetical protein
MSEDKVKSNQTFKIGENISSLAPPSRIIYSLTCGG